MKKFLVRVCRYLKQRFWVDELGSERKQKIYIRVAPHEERGSTMGRGKMSKASAVVTAAVLGVAVVLTLAGVAAALEPGQTQMLTATSAMADGVDTISFQFRAFNPGNWTNIYIDSVASESAGAVAYVTFNVTNSTGAVLNVTTGLQVGQNFSVNTTGVNATIIVTLNSTEPVLWFKVRLEDVGNSSNKTVTTAFTFTASRLVFEPDSVTIKAGTTSGDIHVKATGEGGTYTDPGYDKPVEFFLDKPTYNVWIVKDSTEYHLDSPKQLTMSDGELIIRINGTKADVFNLTVNVTEAPWLQNDTMQIKIDPAEAKYITATVDRASMIAGSETEYINCTFYILDVFNNINYTAVANVNISVSSPAAGTNVTNATAPGDFGRNNMTWLAFTGREGTFRIRIANATMPDDWVAQPYYNITVNATVGGTWLTPKKPEDVGLTVPSGITTEVNLTTNSTILRGFEVEPDVAYKIGILTQCSEFQANGQIREEYNITAVIKDQWDNYCIETTNETGVPIVVTFNITDNRTYAYLSTDMTPDGDSPGPIDVPVENATLGIAVAKIYLWSDKPIAQKYILTVNLTNLQGLLNTSTTVNVTPWLVKNIVIEFVEADGTPKSELIANGVDIAYIIVKLVDDQGNVVTTADGTNFTTALRLVYDANNKSEGWICNKTACASRIGVPASAVVTAVPTNGIIYGNKTEISLYINATATNATVGTDPIQSMRVEANASLPYSVGGANYIVKNASISVAPDEPAKVIIEPSTTETEVAMPVDITVTVYDAYGNIVRDDTVVKFRTTSGLINASGSTSGGQVTPYFTSPHLASTATITAAVMNYAGTAVAATNSTSVTFLPSDASLTTSPEVNDYILEVSPATAPADGSTPVTITVSLKDCYGNTVTDTNATVYLSTTLGTLAATQGELVDGVFTTTLTSTEAGTATITANIGNWVLDTDTVTFTEAPYVFDDTLHLKAGWNFISVPKRLNESCDEFGELFNVDEITTIYGYDPTAGWFVPGPDDEVQVLDGYWVYATAPVDIPLTYRGGRSVPPSKPLKGGAWNAIGFSATTSYSASATLKSVEAYWTTVIGWDASTQTFESAIIKGVNDDEKMYPGKGYWLWVTQDCTLAALSA